MRAASMLPDRLNVANMAACQPKRPRFSTMTRLDPMDSPSTKSKTKIVSDVLFSIRPNSFPL